MDSALADTLLWIAGRSPQNFRVTATRPWGQSLAVAALQ